MATTPAMQMTVGDIEFFEIITGKPFTAFDPETQAMGTPLAALAGIGLYHKGHAPDRTAGMEAARELSMPAAIALMEELLAGMGE